MDVEYVTVPKHLQDFNSHYFTGVYIFLGI